MDFADFDLRHVFGVLMRRRWTVAGTALVFLAVAAAVVAAMTPVYSATALILFDPSSLDVLDTGDPFVSGSSENARIDSEVEMLRSPMTFSRVLRDHPDLVRAELGRTSIPAEALSETQAMGQTIAELRNVISVHRRGLTYLIAVQAQSTSPHRAADLANALAEAGTALQLERKVHALHTASLLVMAQREEMDNPDSRAALDRRARDLTVLANLQLANSAIVSPALPPALPSIPNIPLVLGLSALCGILVGACLAVTQESLFGGLTDEDHARAVLRVQSAVALPRLRLLQSKRVVTDLFTTDPRSTYAEAVRRLQAAVDHAVRSHQRSDGNVIMVTATRAGEGSSSTSLALARSFAADGRSILLIDCNFRAPARHDCRSENSWANEIKVAAASDLRAAIYNEPGSSLTILSGSPEDADATDQLLRSKGFPKLMAAARRTYDVILLDTPSASSEAGPIYAASECDVILLVTRCAVTPQRENRSALNRLREAAGGTPVVAVLNFAEAAHPYRGTLSSILRWARRQRRRGRPAVPKWFHQGGLS